MITYDIDFSPSEWTRVAEKLDVIGRKELHQSIETALAEIGEKLPELAKANARKTLPKRGGLNEVIASTNIPVKIITGTHQVAVRITAEDNAVSEPYRMDQGRVRHPLFGEWVPGLPTQRVTVGWFTKPMADAHDDVRNTLVAAIRTAIARF